jgi:hypothetical protein
VAHGGVGQPIFAGTHDAVVRGLLLRAPASRERGYGTNSKLANVVGASVDP